MCLKQIGAIAFYNTTVKNNYLPSLIIDIGEGDFNDWRLVASPFPPIIILSFRRYHGFGILDSVYTSYARTPAQMAIHRT